MKIKNLSQLPIILILFFLTSCSNKVDKICDCYKKAANTFMIKGEKPNDDDMNKFCLEFEGALKGESAEEKRRMKDSLESIHKNIDEKILFTDVEKLELPVLPCGIKFEDELNNLLKDISSKKKQIKAMNYYLKGRVLTCSIVVNKVVLDINSFQDKPNLYDGMLRVSGELYDNGKILDETIEILIPEKEFSKIKKANRSKPIKNKPEYPFLIDTYRQILKFSGPFYAMPETYVGSVILMFKADTYEYINPNPKTETAVKYEQPRFIFEATSTQTTEQPKEISETVTVKPNNITDNTIGIWTGAFGKDQLTINIESIDANGTVKGYDEVKGNKRNLTGTKTGNTFTLNEPGDDKWDGVFTFSFDKNTNKLTGEWKSNNGKSKKNFELMRN